MDSTIERSQTHATFVIDRDYAPRRQVWNALSDNDARDQWFSAGEFEVGSVPDSGRRTASRGAVARRTALRFHSTYTDIVPGRIVFTYDMWVDGRHMSTSLTTIALNPNGTTPISPTPSRASISTAWTRRGREEGTRGLLDRLGHLPLTALIGTRSHRRGKAASMTLVTAQMSVSPGRLLCRPAMDTAR